MPGAWETQGLGTVLGCIIHTEATTVAWAFGLKNLQIPGQWIALAGMPFCHARNAGAMKAVECGADFLFFLDSDVAPPHDAILRLMAHNLPIVSGIYCRRSPPQGVPVMMRGGQWVTKYPANSLIQVDVVGAGCLLIRRDVLEKLPPQRPGKHWFDWRVDMRGSKVVPDDTCMSEDFTFCQHARKHGYPVMVDTSIMCRHIGLAEAGYGTFGPLNTNPLT